MKLLFNNPLMRVFRRESQVIKTAVAPADLAAGLETSERNVTSSGQGMRIATVYSCMKLLSDSVASLPIEISRKSRGIFIPEDSRLAFLLTVQPNEEMSAFDFWSQTVQYVTLLGNCYIVPMRHRMTGEIERFLLPHPTCVAYDSIHGTYYVNDTQSGYCDTLLSPDIIHIRNTSFDGLQGVGLIAWARQTLGIAATGDEETKQRFANGGNVRGIVSNEPNPMSGFGEYADKQLKKLAQETDIFFRSGGRVIAMPKMSKLDIISSTSADMQFLETRKFSVLEICRFFRVPPSFIFADTAGNYKSAENAVLDLRQNAINPLLCRIENELTRKLLGESDFRKRRIRFDRSALSACDLDAQMKYLGSRIQNGIDTINESRLAQNKPAVPDGDTVLVSANLKTIQELKHPTTSQSNNPTKDEKEN
ncbi:MAG: phage portal protein [Muribaculaceae bacterium]|nr:phage portal protein [Muribaculaceae bacterium]